MEYSQHKSCEKLLVNNFFHFLLNFYEELSRRNSTKNEKNYLPTTFHMICAVSIPFLVWMDYSSPWYSVQNQKKITWMPYTVINALLYKLRLSYSNEPSSIWLFVHGELYLAISALFNFGARHFAVIFIDFWSAICCRFGDYFMDLDVLKALDQKFVLQKFDVMY